MKVLKVNLIMYLLLAFPVKYSLSDEFQEKVNETDFVLKHYCSSQLPNQCLTVFNGNFSFTRAQNICQSFDGVQLNLNDQLTLDIISSILSESDDIHNLVLNAKRAIYTKTVVDLKGRSQNQIGNGNALVLEFSFFKLYPSLEKWDSNYKALCEYKNCSGRDGCYLVSKFSYNWFEARRFCLSIEADLMTDVGKAKAVPKPTSEYWLGASRFYWTWVNSDRRISRLPQTPEWSEPYYEDHSTECASVRISKCGHESCLKWQAHQCDTPTDLSVVCKFNESYFLYGSAKKIKQEIISRGTLVMIVVAVVLVLMTFIAILSYVAIKSRIRRQTDKQRNSTGKHSLVRLERQNKGKAPVNRLPERDETTYETIDGVPEPVYMNREIGEGFYSNQATNTNRPEPPNPRSPAIVVDNEGKKSKLLKNLVKFKIFKRGGKTSADGDKSGSLSTYEPLSLTSFGRRIGSSESNCEGACSPEEHFQETNNYTPLSNDPKE